MSRRLFGMTNANEFYPRHYVSEVLPSDIKPVVDRWNERAKEDKDFESPAKRITRLKDGMVESDRRTNGEDLLAPARQTP